MWKKIKPIRKNDTIFLVVFLKMKEQHKPVKIAYGGSITNENLFTPLIIFVGTSYVKKYPKLFIKKINKYRPVSI